VSLNLEESIAPINMKNLNIPKAPFQAQPRKHQFLGSKLAKSIESAIPKVHQSSEKENCMVYKALLSNLGSHLSMQQQVAKSVQ
jgi:hypothetical protein